LLAFVKKEHQPNAVHRKMMAHEKWTKYFATCNTTKRFKNWWRLQKFTSTLWLFMLMWNDFSLMPPQTKKKENPFWF